MLGRNSDREVVLTRVLREKLVELNPGLPDAAYDDAMRQIDWMRETRTAVVISEEQGEADKFRKWDLDIAPHRRLIKEGMDLPEAMRQPSLRRPGQPAVGDRRVQAGSNLGGQRRTWQARHRCESPREG